MAESSPSASSPGAAGSGSGGGAPNRPLPPTPDDDESQGDKTLVLRRVSCKGKAGDIFARNSCFFLCYFTVMCNDSSRRPVLPMAAIEQMTLTKRPC